MNNLTKQQQKVADLVMKGLNNKEIANQLFLHEKTVKWHLTGIYKTMGVKSRVQLILKLLPANYFNRIGA